MFFVRRKNSGILMGMIIGAAASVIAGGAVVMSNKTLRKEANRELMKIRRACHDVYEKMI